MAEGRMLKKVICESPRLAALKSDTHRLIYTWIIPFLDIEGRHSADPRIVKSHVAPILNHISHRIIRNSLADMAVNNLITLYCIDGKEYLELHNFKKHQNLRDDREKKSDIPPSTPGAIQEYSRRTPAQGKLREVNLSKAKGDAPDPPVDNSKTETPKPPLKEEPKTQKPEPEDEEAPPFDDVKPKEPDGQIRIIMQGILEKRGFQFHRQCELFISDHLKNGNRNAIIHCLSGVLKLAEDIESPRAYLEAAFRTEDGNHNAEDHAREAREKSGPSTARGMEAMGKIMARIGRPS